MQRCEEHSRQKALPETLGLDIVSLPKSVVTHDCSLKSVMVGALILCKLGNKTNQRFSPRKPVVKHLPTHLCLCNQTLREGRVVEVELSLGPDLT